MPLILERHGGVAILTLSRPDRRNAWNAELDVEVSAHLAQFESDDDVRCVVLTGDEAGRAFCAGADLKEPRTHAPVTPADFVKALPRIEKFAGHALADFPKPTIAAVNGPAVGVGYLLTLCCDMIVASDRAHWRMPQASLGILPSYGANARMARVAGKGAVMRAALGFPLDAQEALRCGMAQWLVPHESLMQRTLEIAGEIAALPALAVRLTKESVNRSLEIGNVREAALVDVYRLMVLEASEDSREAHAAWREGRAPEFKGR